MHRMSLLPWIKTGYTENEKTAQNVDVVNHLKTQHQLVEVFVYNLKEISVISIHYSSDQIFHLILNTSFLQLDVWMS